LVLPKAIAGRRVAAAELSSQRQRPPRAIPSKRWLHRIHNRSSNPVLLEHRRGCLKPMKLISAVASPISSVIKSTHAYAFKLGAQPGHSAANQAKAAQRTVCCPPTSGSSAQTRFAGLALNLVLGNRESALTKLPLASDRLLIRYMEPSDKADIVQHFSDASTHAFILKKHKSPDYISRFVDVASSQQVREQSRVLPLTVTLKATNQVMGTIDLLQTPTFDGKAKMGWHFGSSYSGHGYATEASRALLRFAFEVLSLEYVFADCFSVNSRAIRVLTKAGMRPHPLNWLYARTLRRSYGEDRPIVRYRISHREHAVAQQADPGEAPAPRGPT
jgi:ribosomal-protein-alanine N-acetyltransferase